MGALRRSGDTVAYIEDESPVLRGQVLVGRLGCVLLVRSTVSSSELSGDWTGCKDIPTTSSKLFACARNMPGVCYSAKGVSSEADSRYSECEEVRSNCGCLANYSVR